MVQTKAIKGNVFRLSYIVLLFISMVCFKLAIEWGYFYITSNSSWYPMKFNFNKYVIGWLWSIALFIGINHKKRTASTFMIYLVYIFQIIPITCIYALADESNIFYNTTCIAFLIFELWCGHTKITVKREFPYKYTVWMQRIFIILVVLILLIVFIRNGLPTLQALDIYDVYEIRSSGSFKLSKYENYIFSWIMQIILPFLAAKMVNEKKYQYVILILALIFLFYLYSGHKTYLFSIVLLVVCAFIMNFDFAYEKFFIILSFAICAIVILASFSPILKEAFDALYSLFVRRMLLVSATDKFYYYDFFSNTAKIGIAGMFPQWLVPVENPYGDTGIGYVIGAVYLNSPSTNVNTGFLAEGYMRFGYFGIFIEFIVFDIVLQLMDNMQARAGYAFVICAFIYPVMSLSDAHLIDSLIFGSWMIGIIIILLYRGHKREISP